MNQHINEVLEEALESLIIDKLSKASLYEQLAEECVELAHACQKKARKLRGENPTPLSMSEIDDAVSEELTDVTLVAKLLGLDCDLQLYWEKYDRWCSRLNGDL